MNQIDLSDVRALIARSEKHYTEYTKLMRGLITTTKSFDISDQNYVYTLIYSGSLLIEGKPILLDAANNLASAMDHIVSAMARQNGVTDNPRLYFPFSTQEADFQKTLTKVKRHIGSTNAQILSAHYQKYNQEKTHVDALKKLANNGKHWKLDVPSVSPETIAMNQEHGPQKFVNVPTSVFENATSSEFEFYRESARMWDEQVYVVVKEEIVGLTDHHLHSPDTIIRCSTRYVKGLVSSIELQTLSSTNHTNP